MKKWMYLIFPGIMLAGFLGLYFSHQKEALEREHTRTEEMAKKAAKDKAQKDEAEAKATVEAKKRQADREAEDAKKDADRRAKQEAIDKEIRDKTNAFLAEADKLSKEAADLEIQLDRLHKEKDQASREAFDLAKQVELGRVAKRTAEFEIQRYTEMISKRADTSSMARMPPPPPPVAAPKS